MRDKEFNYFIFHLKCVKYHRDLDPFSDPFCPLPGSGSVKYWPESETLIIALFKTQHKDMYIRRKIWTIMVQKQGTCSKHTSYRHEYNPLNIIGSRELCACTLSDGGSSIYFLSRSGFGGGKNLIAAEINPTLGIFIIWYYTYILIGFRTLPPLKKKIFNSVLFIKMKKTELQY